MDAQLNNTRVLSNHKGLLDVALVRGACSAHISFIFTLTLLVVQFPAWGAIQPAWIARYSTGATKNTNQAVAITLDGAGNIVVAGSSTGAKDDYDYVAIKYAPNGTGLWVNRYVSLSNGHDQVRALAIDLSNAVLVTGTSATVKYSAEGLQEWETPYGGRGMTVDSNANVYVTGYSTDDFATVKLDSRGSNIWARTYDQVGQRDISDAVEVDGEGSVYVAGRQSWRVGYDYSGWAVVKYDQNGNAVWTNANIPSFVGALASITQTTVKSLAVTGDGFLYFVANLFGGGLSFYAARLDASTGLRDWIVNPETTSLEGATAAVVDSVGNSYLTGRLVRKLFELVGYATFKLNSSGQTVWQASYQPTDAGYHIANAIALDPAGNVYVTGTSVNASGDNDWATIKYSPDGKEQWVQRHDGPAHANDEANAIAVDASGNVYVAGTHTATNGLLQTSELVVIKYSELENIRLQPDHGVALQFFGTPGQFYRFQATTNFPSWNDIGNGIASTDGIVRFTDTNAPTYPHRFYRLVSP